MPEPGFLDRVVRFRERAEHPVGHGPQVSAVGLELFLEPLERRHPAGGGLSPQLGGLIGAGRAARSAFLEAIQNRLDVDDWRPIQGLEVENLEAEGAFALDNPDPVNPHWVRPILRARAEDAAQRNVLIIPGMNPQRPAVAPVEPCEDQDLLACSQVPQAGLELRLEDEPRFGCSLVSLLRSVFRMCERGADKTDGSDRNQ